MITTYNGIKMNAILVKDEEYAAQFARFLMQEKGLSSVVIEKLDGKVYVSHHLNELKPHPLKDFKFNEPKEEPPPYSTSYNTKEEAFEAANHLLKYTPRVTIQLFPDPYKHEYLVEYDKSDVPDTVDQEIAAIMAEKQKPVPRIVGCTAKTPQVLLTFGNMAEASVFLACLHAKNDGPEVTLKHEYGPTNAECRTTLEIMDARHFIVCMYALLWPFIKEPTFKPR